MSFFSFVKESEVEKETFSATFYLILHAAANETFELRD
jgi:hypothetical protein